MAIGGVRWAVRRARPAGLRQAARAGGWQQLRRARRAAQACPVQGRHARAPARPRVARGCGRRVHNMPNWVKGGVLQRFVWAPTLTPPAGCQRCRCCGRAGAGAWRPVRAHGNRLEFCPPLPLPLFWLRCPDVVTSFASQAHAQARIPALPQPACASPASTCQMPAHSCARALTGGPHM